MSTEIREGLTRANGVSFATLEAGDGPLVLLLHGFPGVVPAVLSYYRGLVRVPRDKPDFYEKATQNIKVPMLVVYGEDDPARTLSEGERPFFDGEYRREIVPGAGHFVHREQPEQLTRLLLEQFSPEASTMTPMTSSESRG